MRSFLVEMSSLVLHLTKANTFGTVCQQVDRNDLDYDAQTHFGVAESYHVLSINALLPSTKR
jgi:hypothetical protein